MSTAQTAHIKHNTLLNLAGSVAPIFISLVTVPLYLRLIGNARYGVMAIVWVLLGYFGVFNLGLGRATANQVARYKGAPQEDVEALFWTAFLMNVGGGLMGAAIILVAGNLLFNSVLRIPSDLRPEALAALPWLAAAVPVTTVSAVLWGALEGRERFDVVNGLAVFGTILSQLMPLWVAYRYGPELGRLIGATVLALAISGGISLIVCFRIIPLAGPPRFHPTWTGRLFRFGGWITVTALVGPFLTTLDQLVIGSKVGVQTLPYYSVPYNLVTRLSLLPSSLSRTLFPRFSMLTMEESRSVGNVACLALGAIMTPVIVITIVLIQPFLKIWIGPEMAQVGGPVGEIILVGVWLNSLALIPYALLQGQGRPDLTAKFHLLELPIYVAALWLGLATLGLPGAALAWTLRVLLDTALLFRAARIPWKNLTPLLLAAALMLLACFSGLTIFQYPAWQILLGGIYILASILWAWRVAPLNLRMSLFSFLKRWMPHQVGV